MPRLTKDININSPHYFWQCIINTEKGPAEAAHIIEH